MMIDKMKQNMSLFAIRSYSSPFGSVKLVIWSHKLCFQDLLSVGFLLGSTEGRIEGWKKRGNRLCVVYLSLRHHLILIIRPCVHLFQGTSFQSLDSGPWVLITLPYVSVSMSRDGSNILLFLLLILLLLVCGLSHHSFLFIVSAFPSPV